MGSSHAAGDAFGHSISPISAKRHQPWSQSYDVLLGFRVRLVIQVRRSGGCGQSSAGFWASISLPRILLHNHSTIIHTLPEGPTALSSGSPIGQTKYRIHCIVTYPVPWYSLEIKCDRTRIPDGPAMRPDGPGGGLRRIWKYPFRATYTLVIT